MRYYYRCNDCLTTSTLEERRHDLRCICGGKIVCLGQVEQDRWTRRVAIPKCDGRCVHARGPKCDCECKGANHGAGLAGYIEVRVDGGPVILRPVNPEEAIRRAEEYRAAKQEVYDALADVYGQAWETYRTGGWVSNPVTWREIRSWHEAINAAKTLRTHKGRIQRLRQIAEHIRKR